jgi:hypothetical protein
MILHSLHLPLVVLRHRAVHLLPQALNHHQEAHLPEKVHLRRLLIQIIHQQINLLLKVAVVNPKQAKLKQQVIPPANQVLV